MSTINSTNGMSAIKMGLVGLSLIAFLPSIVLADKTDDIVNAGVKRTQAGAASQKRIDDISDKTDKIVSQFHQQSKVVEGLKVYNDRLRRTLEAQQVAVTKLERSIEDASLIERQIVPLMMRMIVGLEKFVAADIPFKTKERNERIERIRGYLTNANISAAERFRQVLNAYSIENAYGQTIDVYTEALNLSGAEKTVNILQVGRTGLYYQTLNGNESGYWDREGKEWKQLDASYNEGITSAIRMTQGKEVQDLMKLPIAAPQEAI